MAKKKSKMKEPVMVSPSQDETWKAEGDFRTLTDAEEIKQDPERLKKALAVGDKKMKAIRSIEDLKEYKNSKYGAGSEMEEEDED